MDSMELWCGWCKKAYISVMGAEKWYGLTVQQQHDIVMTMAKDLLAALDNIK